MPIFSLFIHESGSIVPTLAFEVAGDYERVRALAAAALAASPDRLLVEVREADRLLFSIDRNGVTWSNHEGRREVEAPGLRL